MLSKLRSLRNSEQNHFCRTELHVVFFDRALILKNLLSQITSKFGEFIYPAEVALIWLEFKFHRILLTGCICGL